MITKICQFRQKFDRTLPVWIVLIALVTNSPIAIGQSVGLPAPRLLTTMPMGGSVGSTFDVTISGENLEETDDLTFSDHRIHATKKLDAMGQPEPNKFVVSIAADCPTGLYEARIMSRLGISSSRIFSVGTLPEVVRTSPNTTLATAMQLKINSICNAVISPRAVDYYKFAATQGQRIIVECSTRGIDSKLEAVLIIGDAKGADLVVERRTGLLDFTVPQNGTYVIKLNELTYGGGPAFYYRLALTELPAGAPIVRLPSTKTVSSFSWPPVGLAEHAALREIEPNNNGASAQKISLPCDITGSFFPAADVDVFEFDGKKGDVWWIEIASERFGLPTDPAGLVQRVVRTGDQEKFTDVLELNDIPSPVKVSSNGYSYDGPPYQAGSPDFLGKLEIAADGVYRLQVSDLFGGTRNDPRNIYRLVIRKAEPDFALVSWAIHMELRNGDRNALSKPLALRGGSTMALEVIAVRRDGFNDEINLEMENLPDGVTAKGLKIPAGQSRGIMLVTAHQDAPRSLKYATIFGRAEINGATVARPCRLASMAWPIPEAWNEIPSPRLMADIPVSVSGFEFAPLTVSTAGKSVFEVTAGEKLTIPLVLNRRCEFSGAVMQMKAFGAGFEHLTTFDLPLTADFSETIIDTKAMGTKPGDYTIAFYGGAVAKYKISQERVSAAEETLQTLESELNATKPESIKLTEAANTAPVERKAEADKSLEDVKLKLLAIEAKRQLATVRLAELKAAAQPRDLVDIVVSEPISIRVKAAEQK